MKKDYIVTHFVLSKKLKQIKENNYIFFMYSQTGWGKTCSVKKCFENQKEDYDIISAILPDFKDMLVKSTKNNIIIDDLHTLQDSDTIKFLNEYLRQYIDEKFFVLLSRAKLPGWLVPLSISGRIYVADYKYLAFSVGNTMEIALKCGCRIDMATAQLITDQCYQYPFAIKEIIMSLINGDTVSQEMLDRVKYKLFQYMDCSVFGEWPQKLQDFLLKIAPFESFNTEMAIALSEDENAPVYLKSCLNIGSFLSFKPFDNYEFVEFFHEFLLYKLENDCTKEFVNRILGNAGKYYDEQNDIAQALDYYKKIGNRDKIIELLERAATMNVSMVRYDRLQPFYFELDDAQIENSILLMSGISMLYSIMGNCEKSDIWYNKIKEKANNLSETEPDYLTARRQLMMLNIGLPHHKVENLPEVLLFSANEFKQGQDKFLPVSVTSNQPSLLNGSLDFSSWCKIDKQLYTVLKKPLSIILGNSGAGLAEIAIAESALEKDYNTESYIYILEKINEGYTEAKNNNAYQLEFAALAVKARLLVMNNSYDAALNIMMNFRNRMEDMRQNNLIPNIDAFIVGLKLFTNNISDASLWLKSKAPDEYNFFAMERYRYFIKARCYIVMEKYLEAYSLLDILLKYCIKYNRPYGEIEARLLIAITLDRMNNTEAADYLSKALSISERFGFYRIAASFGSALLPLLIKYDIDLGKSYKKKLLSTIQKQALLYPNYLLPDKNNSIESLTDSEMNILSLMASGNSYNDIALIAGISINTVKYHTKNILKKLGAKNRQEAVQIIDAIGILKN